MKKLGTAYCQTGRYFFCGNGQDVREAILRQAVKSCDCYATDIVIFFSSQALLDFLDKGDGDLSIWFRASGVDWDKEPDKYRYHMKLVKGKDNIFLYGEASNL